MNQLELIFEVFPDETFLKADGFDDAVIGYDWRTMRLIYSVNKCLEILQQQGMTQEEALEHFEYNVVGSYIGEQTPVFLDSVDYM